MKKVFLVKTTDYVKIVACFKKKSDCKKYIGDNEGYVIQKLDVETYKKPKEDFKGVPPEPKPNDKQQKVIIRFSSGNTKEVFLNNAGSYIVEDITTPEAKKIMEKYRDIRIDVCGNVTLPKNNSFD